jgi:hypothetical protein
MIDMSPRAITARLREVASQTDLAGSDRHRYKLDMSRGGITRRLERVEALRRLCVELGRIGERNGLGASRHARRPP